MYALIATHHKSTGQEAGSVSCCFVAGVVQLTDRLSDLTLSRDLSMLHEHMCSRHADIGELIVSSSSYPNIQLTNLDVSVINTVPAHLLSDISNCDTG